jgi:hypothetical protein
MENGNRMVLTLVIALATTVANGGLFVLHRLFEMDGEQAALRVGIEQRLGRVENKLDTLLRLAGEARRPPPR